MRSEPIDGQRADWWNLPVSVLGEGIVLVAIQPAFTVFSRGDDGMAAAAGMGAGVPVGRGVTTSRTATALTRSQVYPPGAHLHAVLTDALGRLLDRLYRLDV